MAKRIMITGATGMVGSLVLNHCIKDDSISQIVSIGRRSSGISHDKLRELNRTDFLNYEDIKEEFLNIDRAYFCLGVYTGSVTKEKLMAITYDYVVSFSNMLKRESPNASFSFLSGMGADREEKNRTAFAKAKGMAENHLLSLGLNSLAIFRPGYIYPVEKRAEPNLMYSISRALYPVLKFMGEKYSITSEQLAEAIYSSGFIQPSVDTMENRDILDYLRSITTEV